MAKEVKPTGAALLLTELDTLSCTRFTDNRYDTTPTISSSTLQWT
jgi:hypothetical protein